MENNYIFTLVQRFRPTESSIWTDAYAVPRGEKGKEESLIRKIVSQFLKTSEGKHAIEDTMSDFNWGDTHAYIPLHFWAKYGVFPLSENGNGPYNMGNYEFEDFAVIGVNQDEILCI